MANKMNKKLLSVGLCLLTVFSFTGCKGEVIENPTNDDRFQIIKNYNDGFTCYDKNTGYVYFCNTDYTGGHTILLNKEGKPYKYKGWDINNE